MKKNYITSVPDRVGAFLTASNCLAELGINMTRVSYNKAIDAHTLFIEAEGTPEQLQQADERLARLGYLQSEKTESRVVLLQFRLKDEPGSVAKIVQLIDRFGFNISYISYRDTPADVEDIKMGLYVDNEEHMQAFLACAAQLCQVQVVEYDCTERFFDNSIFYHSFISGLAQHMELTDAMRDKLMVSTNLAMQMLDDKGTSPYRAFDSIGRFAEHLASFRGEAFQPRITRHALTQQTELILIEPPCGSNTAILKSGEQVLFIDTGYACYRREMEAIFRRELPDYDSMKKTVLITHADLDHCGLLPWFDEVLLSRKSYDILTAEAQGRKSWREKIPGHEPYINICKTLTLYSPPPEQILKVRWGTRETPRGLLEQVGYFDFGDLHFEVYEGQGGHVPGELVLLDYEHNIAFTGDVYLNLKGQTPEQAVYNRYAPILMSSVDTDQALCTRERKAILQRLGVGKWQIFSGHGCKKDYDVSENR